MCAAWCMSLPPYSCLNTLTLSVAFRIPLFYDLFETFVVLIFLTSLESFILTSSSHSFQSYHEICIPSLTFLLLPLSACSSEEFECDRKCVPASWRCDGDRDCADGTDELNCSYRPGCGPDRFRCADGFGCIPKRWVCDGKAECRDGSDEMSCSQKGKSVYVCIMLEVCWV